MIPLLGAWRGPARPRLFQLLTLGSGVFALADSPLIYAAEAVQFQSGFMRQNGDSGLNAEQSALAALTDHNELGPGRYFVEVAVNLIAQGQQELTFTAGANGLSLQACLSAALLEKLGVKLDSVADQTLLDAECVDLVKAIPGANAEFDSTKLLLKISIPQVNLQRDKAGYVDPARWDYGVNAAFLNYQASAQQGHSDYRGSSNSQDLYLLGGFNLGAWRFRSNQSLRNDPQGKREWTRAYAYLQRDIPNTFANLTLGETFTSGDVFRSVPITGALLASDSGMLTDMMQAYAPVIRGVAQSRAKLEILRDGRPIYSTYVSPGPYEIDDISVGGGSGELQIVLTEADGQVRRFTQPYASLGNLLREDVWRYSAVVGRYNAAGNQEQPILWQTTAARGMPWSSTLYGGLMASNFYRAGNVGIAKDLGNVGALAFDVTQSSADIEIPGQSQVQGSSYALKYGKSFNTGTNLRFAGYRYSTQGYRDFDEALRQRSQSTTFQGNRRSRLEAALYQNFGLSSSVNLTLSNEDFWGTDYQRRQFQLSFSSQYKKISYNLYASKSLSDDNDNMGYSDQQVGLSVSMPLDFGSSTAASFGVEKSAGRLSQRASVTGINAEQNLNYMVSLSNDGDYGKSANLSLSRQTPTASYGAGYNQSDEYRSLSLNASGALLLHADGVQFTPYLGETFGLVQVPGIAEVGVVNGGSVRTDKRGYTVMPYLRPYRVNQVVIQTDNLGPDVEIDNGTAQVVPRRGAVVKAVFPARRVTRLVITGQTLEGQPWPFGAQVMNAAGTVIGSVGQAGQAMLSTDMTRQQLTVHWGDSAEQQCRFEVDPTTMTPVDGYRLQELTCR